MGKRAWRRGCWARLLRRGGSTLPSTRKHPGDGSHVAHSHKGDGAWESSGGQQEGCRTVGGPAAVGRMCQSAGWRQRGQAFLTPGLGRRASPPGGESRR